LNQLFVAKKTFPSCRFKLSDITPFLPRVSLHYQAPLFGVMVQAWRTASIDDLLCLLPTMIALELVVVIRPSQIALTRVCQIERSAIRGPTIVDTRQGE